MSLDSKELVKGLKTASGQLKGFDQKLKSTGRSLTTKVSAPLAALGGLAIKQSMNFQRLRVSLETLAGGAEKGSEAFEKLVEFSAKTPFQLDELVKVNNMLMGFGLTTDQARDSLKLLGDVAAISGGSLQGIGVAFGQSAAEGRIMTRDLLQFINNGVPMLKLLADELGVSTRRVREMASEGALSFPLVVRALERATTTGGMFENGMEKLSKTMAGTASNIKDNLTIALATLGDQMVETFNVEQLGKDFVQFIKDITKTFKEMEPATRDLVVQMGAFAATAGPILYLAGTVIPKLVRSIKYLTANPIVLGITAVTLALVKLKEEVGGIEDLNEKAKVAQEGIKKFTAELKNIEQSEGYLSGSEDALKRYHETNLELQKAIKANAEAQIEFAKGLGTDGVKTVKEYSEILDMAEGNILASEAALKTFGIEAQNTKKPVEDVTGTIEDLGKATRDSAQKLLKFFQTPEEKLRELQTNTKKLGGVIFGDKLKFATEGPKGGDISLALSDAQEKENKKLKDAQEAAKDQTVGFSTDISGILANGMTNAAMALGSGTAGIGDVLGSLVSMLGDVAIHIGKTAIKIGLGMAAVKMAFTNPFTAIAAGVALVAIGSLVKGLADNFSGGGGAQPFANGGIVSGPTLGLIGEYSGARSNPEVVAPLDKLKGMIGQQGQNVNVGGEFRIQGQDLVVALQRAERNRKRIV